MNTHDSTLNAKCDATNKRVCDGRFDMSKYVWLLSTVDLVVLLKAEVRAHANPLCGVSALRTNRGPSACPRETKRETSSMTRTNRGTRRRVRV
jgi:hypothetical protein